MAHDYTPRVFFRQTPNALLEVYFRERATAAGEDWDALRAAAPDPARGPWQALAKIDWATLAETDIEPVYTAWQGLAKSEREASESDTTLDDDRPRCFEQRRRSTVMGEPGVHRRLAEMPGQIMIGRAAMWSFLGEDLGAPGSAAVLVADVEVRRLAVEPLLAEELLEPQPEVVFLIEGLDEPIGGGADPSAKDCVVEAAIHERIDRMLVIQLVAHVLVGARRRHHAGRQCPLALVLRLPLPRRHHATLPRRSFRASRCSPRALWTRSRSSSLTAPTMAEARAR